MNVIVKGGFERDVRKIRNKKLKLALSAVVGVITNNLHSARFLEL
jgi:hypothetical protein